MSEQSEQLKRGKLYPLADRVPEEIREQLDPSRRNFLESSLRARWNGEFRAPKKGEWYLSGAIIAAYRARADFIDLKYHLAEIVETELVPEVRRFVRVLR